MLTNLNKILSAARRGGYAVGAFNINNLEIAQGVAAAAVKMRAPVVLQMSEGALEYAGLEYLAGIAHVAAEASRVPVVVHLDHGRDEVMVERVIKSGWVTSVMIDASRYDFKKNVAVTRRVVELAHKRGISVEAELGPIFGVEDRVKVLRGARSADSVFTDPAQVKKFVAETGCDALAVSVGTAHGAVKYAPGEKPKLDLARLGEIARATKIPLVLHGASSVPHAELLALHAQCARLGDCARVHGAVGVPESEIKKAIKLGVAKVNVDTDLRMAFTAAVRQIILTDHATIDPRKLLAPARTAIQKVVEGKIKMFGSGRKG